MGKANSLHSIILKSLQNDHFIYLISFKGDADDEKNADTETDVSSTFRKWMNGDNLDVSNVKGYM